MSEINTSTESASITSHPATANPVLSSHDKKVADAVESYLAEMEAGRRPPREQFLRKYPEISEELAVCLDGLDFVHHVAPQLKDEVGDDQPPIQDAIQRLQSIGDFHILREIGRGGMGVVYEAEQLSLQRHVALKVLPFAAVLDPRHLQRFKNEALAAAQLEHAHIVPVYGVGCDRGVHHYAMRFIEGQTLAQSIDRLRSGQALVDALTDTRHTTRHNSDNGSVIADLEHLETPAAGRDTARMVGLSTELSATSRDFFRAAATLARDVARALDYAHERGIVHRDIKPSNLMLDGDGKAWVTDFGLAHIESDVSLTMSGDLVGTLRYMSPEQVLARRVVIDHRTDIYSLGATLYELLTLQPAFPQTDRQELIRRITFEDPKSPRQINPLTPRELETIVVKAMEKNPNERYETAEELADDLQRFLNHEPIKARRATVRQRITKWSTRHAKVVWPVALVLLLMTLTLGASTTWVFSAYQRESQVAAQAQAVISFLTDDLLAQADPANEPDRDVKLRTVLDRAAQEIDQRFGDSLLVKATILLTLGKTYLSLGDYAQAQRHLQAAADIYQQQLGDEHPDTLRALQELGELRFDEGQLEAAERLLGDVLQARQRILGAEHPETLDSLHSVGQLSLEFGQLGAAARLFSEVLQGRQAVLGDDHPATLAARMAMSECMLRVGQVERAQRHLQEAQASLLRSYGPQHPRTLDAQYRLASIDLQQDRLEEAVPALQSLREQGRQSLGEAHPFTLRVQSALARGYLQEERLPDAEHLGRQTLDTSEAALGAEHGITTQARQVWADVLLHLQRFSEAEAQFLEVLECELRTRGHGQPSVLAALQGLDTVYEGLGLVEEATQTQQMVRSEAPLAEDSVFGLAVRWRPRMYSEDAVSNAVSTSLAPWRPRTYSADAAAELAQQQTWEGQQPWFIDRFVPPGSLGLDSPRGMTFGPDGHLYVSSGTADTSPHEVRRYQGPMRASPGAPLPAPGQSGAVFVSDASGGLNNPQGLEFGPDGNLYVASTGTDSVLRYHGTTGRFLDTFIPEGSGGLDEPSDLAFRPGGLLYVASRGSDEVLRFDPATGAFVDAVVPAGSDGLDRPAGLTFDAEGRLYVSSGGTSRVLRYGTESQADALNQKLAPVTSPRPDVPSISVEDVQLVEGNEPVQRAEGNSGMPLKIAHQTNGGPTLLDGGMFGRSVALLGDLDGDAITDLAVGASDSPGFTSRGAVHIVYLNADGTVKSTTKIASGINGGPMLANYAFFGISLTSLGDLDGDGITELAVGANGYDHFRGAVYVLFLNSDGTAKSFTKIAHNTGGGPTLDQDAYGSSVALLGDLDGDGITDMAVGSPGGNRRGAVHVQFMNADGTVKSFTKIAHETGGGPTLADGDSFGWSVASLGDLDGDSVTELAVGARHDQPGGAMYVLFLNADGTAKSYTKIARHTGGGPMLADSDEFGSSVASLGDLDGDGVTELSVGAVGDDTGGNRSGAVHILFLNANGTVKSSTKIAHETGGGPTLADGDNFGWSVASLGDLDGQSVTELAVGAMSDNTGGPDRGAMYVLNLNPDGMAMGATCTFTVTRSGDTSEESSVDFTTIDGTAIAGRDYTAVSGTVKFQGGETTKTITVPVNGDTVPQPDKTFFLSLSGPQNATLVRATVQATIHDDDSPVAIAISDASRTEGDAGASQLVFTVTRLGDTSGSTTVDWNTHDGTALAGSDYMASEGTISFPDDDGTPNTVMVSVPILGDRTEEPHETFQVKLSNPVGGSIVTPGSIGTIVNDETYHFVDQLMTAGSGRMPGSSNVICGPEGNLYAASIENDSVLRYDGTTGAFLDVFATNTHGELDAPWAMAFGPDGNLYVAGRASGNVLRYDAATGALIDEYVPAGGWDLQRPRGLTFGPDGQLYVVCSETDSVHRYDKTTGVFIDEFVTSGSGGLDDPWDLAFHDGHLTVSSHGTDSILQYDAVTGAFEQRLIQPGQGGLARPRGLLFGTENDLYVACAGDVDAVLKFEASTGRFLGEFIPQRGADYALDDPCGLVWGDADQHFVSDSGPQRNVVLQFDRNGRYVEESFTTGSDKLDGPLRLAYHPSGRLFVTSARSNNVYVLPLQDGPDAKEPRVSAFPLPKGSKRPFALAFDSDSNLYVSCYGSNEILRYGPGLYAVFKGRLATHRHRPSPLAGERR